MDIGGILGGIAGIGSMIGQGIISKQNLDFQKEAFAYQKELNAQYLDRMDNRLQYLVKDAKSAGINPLAALGQAGGYSSQSAGQAPQQDSSYLDRNPVTDGITTAKLFQDFTNAEVQNQLLLSQVDKLKADTVTSMLNNDTIRHNLTWFKSKNQPTTGNITLNNAIAEILSNITKKAEPEKKVYNLFDKLGNKIRTNKTLHDFSIGKKYFNNKWR